MTTSKAERPFLPAAGRDLFLPLYDPITKLLGVDSARRTLLDQAALERHHRVLDLGCGTGSLAVLVKRLYPTVTVIALDPDARALARARAKAGRASVDIRFDRGFADALPYPDDSFDRILSSMMFHHLDEGDRRSMLREARRVLRPGGRLELLDFAGPGSRSQGPLGRLIHAHHRLSGNDEASILGLLRTAGFTAPRRVRDEATIFGRLAWFTAAAPE